MSGVFRRLKHLGAAAKKPADVVDAYRQRVRVPGAPVFENVRDALGGWLAFRQEHDKPMAVISVVRARHAQTTRTGVARASVSEPVFKTRVREWWLFGTRSIRRGVRGFG